MYLFYYCKKVDTILKYVKKYKYFILHLGYKEFFPLKYHKYIRKKQRK
jgi:hypothetical protein